ncbi:MAG: class I SAM-dependent methyltransferase [Candidatus Omnitrophica bacterium]|nr:class I SAM-dependent methyltransferase [Candidatus Omnitrophota bacterium]
MKKRTSRNLKYKTKELMDFFSVNRQRWEEFYPSERRAFQIIALKDRSLGDILDVGCACGGLGAALEEIFTFKSYTGIDINDNVIEWARKHRKLSVPAKFIADDVLNYNLEKKYHLVVSLSCADWNVETKRIIKYCWARVKPGGHFVISLRLTTGKSICDIGKSFQYINFSGKKQHPEIANYVVFNFKDALGVFRALSPRPELIGAYGYYGRPSVSAVTAYKELVFAVFYIKKQAKGFRKTKGIRCEFDLPLAIFK